MERGKIEYNYGPKSLIRTVLEGVHGGQGNQGIERCILRLNLVFNWIDKYCDIRNHVNSCPTCNKIKTRADGKVKLGKLLVSKPLRLSLVMEENQY